MDASSSSNHGVVSCCAPPYLALKHVEGSDQPIFYGAFSEKKAGAGVVEGRRLDSLTNTNCWATPQGWLLIRDAPSLTTYLADPHHNPTDTDTGRNRIIPLPHLPEENLSSQCTCLLSDYPSLADASYAAGAGTSSSCLVLLVETDAAVIWYCRIGDDEAWVRHEYDIGTLDLCDGESEKLVICPIAACRGKFYFNGCDFKEIGALEFSSPDASPVSSTIVIRNPIAGPKGFRKAFMVESGQELFMVSLMSGLDLDDICWFSVHKMDFVRDEWIEVDDIGDRAFLLSYWYFGASRSADECGLERNCVYMPYTWNKCMMIFNVGDGTAKVQDLDGAPASDQLLWMLPTHP